MYPECAQLTITGGGTLAPTASELCTFPGCYSNTDPGRECKLCTVVRYRTQSSLFAVTIDIYSNAAQTQTTYPIPGPPLYGSSGSSSSAPSSPSSTVSSVSSSSTSKPSTSSGPTSTSSSVAPSGSDVARYGQCGGQGWTGGTVCASPYTCTVSNGEQLRVLC